MYTATRYISDLRNALMVLNIFYLLFLLNPSTVSAKGNKQYMCPLAEVNCKSVALGRDLALCVEEFKKIYDCSNLDNTTAKQNFNPLNAPKDQPGSPTETRPSNPTKSGNGNVESSVGSAKPKTSFEQLDDTFSAGTEGKREQKIILEQSEIDARKTAQRALRLAEARAQANERNRSKSSPTKAREIDRDTQIVRSARQAEKEGGSFPIKKFQEVADSEVRVNLAVMAAAKGIEEDVGREKVRVGAELAQLLMMAATNLRNIASVDTISPTTQLPAGVASGSYAAPAISQQLNNLNDGKSEKPNPTDDLSAEGSVENLQTGIGDGEASVLSEEAKARLKDGIAQAASRKKALSLKERLRAKIKGKDDSTGDTEKLFSGDLTPKREGRFDTDLDSASRGLASTSPADGDYKSTGESLFFQAKSAMQNGFSMDSSQTDSEVKRMLDEAEHELGPEDIRAGILGVDSLSLFERVKTVLEVYQTKRLVGIELI